MANDKKTEDIESKIEAWRAEHGDVVVFRPPGFPVCVFRPPKLEVIEPVINEITRDKGKKAEALRSLAQQCVIHPTLDELRLVFKRFGALPLKVGGMLFEMSGADLEADEKKA